MNISLTLATLVVALALFVTTLYSQNVLAGGFVCCGVDIDIEEAVEAEKLTNDENY